MNDLQEGKTISCPGARFEVKVKKPLNFDIWVKLFSQKEELAGILVRKDSEIGRRYAINLPELMEFGSCLRVDYIFSGNLIQQGAVEASLRFYNE